MKHVCLCPQTPYIVFDSEKLSVRPRGGGGGVGANRSVLGANGNCC